MKNAAFSNPGVRLIIRPNFGWRMDSTGWTTGIPRQALTWTKSRSRAAD